MILFDSHCHLQDKRLGDDVERVLERAWKAGVARMVCCAARFDDWERVKYIAETVKSVIPSFGIHPWYLDSAPEGWLDALQAQLLSLPSGVGEIGLDFAVEDADRGRQERFFRAQLKMANALKRPVSIHCRKAWQRLVEILKEEGLRCGAVVHSYSGAAEMAPALERAGAYLSFSGAVVRSYNIKGRRSAAAVSADRLLIETDSPDFAPPGVSSPVNEPANIVRIAEAVAHIRHTDTAVLAQQTYDNGMRLFGSVCT
mgnify:CR=1 FL=1